MIARVTREQTYLREMGSHGGDVELEEKEN